MLTVIESLIRPLLTFFLSYFWNFGRAIWLNQFDSTFEALFKSIKLPIKGIQLLVPIISLKSFVIINTQYRSPVPGYQSKMKFIATFACLLIIAATRISAVQKKEFVSSCSSTLLAYDEPEAITFFCDYDFHNINYFVPNAVRRCGNSKPIQTANELTTMSFKDCDMEYFPYHVFPAYPQLENLDISDMGLQSLRPEIFDRAQKLLEFNASKNNLKTLHSELFALVTTLKKINLRENSLTQIPLAGFHKLQDLSELDLSYKSIDINRDWNIFGT